jgi:4a-hydroxytetrahydrobiopterin dehydratase
MKTPPLNAEELARACAGLPGWAVERDALARTFTFGSFREAMSFMVRVSYEAEALDHHPEWSNVYNRVALRLTTHDAGDTITAKDVELAARIERIAAGWI